MECGGREGTATVEVSEAIGPGRVESILGKGVDETNSKCFRIPLAKRKPI